MKLFESGLLEWEETGESPVNYIYHGDPEYTYFIEYKELYIERFYPHGEINQQLIIPRCSPQHAEHIILAIENITACTRCVGTGKQTYWYAANSWDHSDGECPVCNGKGYVSNDWSAYNHD